jgi:hypothetical protein
MTNDVTHYKQNGPKVVPKFHVQFFGPKPLHAWIPNSSIRPYMDPDEVAAWKERDMKMVSSMIRWTMFRNDIINQ